MMMLLAFFIRISIPRFALILAFLLLKFPVRRTFLLLTIGEARFIEHAYHYILIAISYLSTPCNVLPLRKHMSCRPFLFVLLIIKYTEIHTYSTKRFLWISCVAQIWIGILMRLIIGFLLMVR